MSVSDIAILAMTVLGGAAAVLLVTSRNVVHSALYLVVTLIAVAGAFLAMGAELLAWAQVLVYVGAVVVLILFGLMLTRAPIGPAEDERLGAGRSLPIAVAGGLFAVLTTLIVSELGDTRMTLQHVRVGDVGDVLFTQWALPFITLGFLLTAALIGALSLARAEDGEGPPAETEAPPRRSEPVPTDASSLPSGSPADGGDDRRGGA